MPDTPLPLVSLDGLPLKASSHGSVFAVETGEIGDELGLSRLGAMLHIVPPGKAAFPFHRHHVSDELFLILKGTGTYRLGARKIPVKAGDCLGAPAGGEAHQIINTGTEPLHYIGFSNNDVAEVVDYPDSGQILARARHEDASVFRARGFLTPAGYWDGVDGEALK